MLQKVWGRARRISWSLALSTATTAAMAEEPTLDLFRLPDEPLTTVSNVSGLSAIETDVVKERYPSGKLKIERTVTLDATDNYVNHGPWTMWDEQGRNLGGGEYRQGQRDGHWTRHFHQDNVDVVASPMAHKFQAPFTAEATFAGDKLHGIWTVIDGKKRIVYAWSYENGRRHGKCVWCYPSGQPWREATYVDGQLDGEVLELGADQSLVSKDIYRQGRQLKTKVEWYSSTVKKLEATLLLARDSEGTTDDFWNGISLPLAPAGRVDGDQRHGLWTSWHSNGQVALQGQYENDQPEGAFSWWHPNGQRAIEGNFSHGQPTGAWTWWHDNGLKEMRGTFLMGLQAGKWNRWNPDGKLLEAVNFPETGAPASGLADLSRLTDLKPTVVTSTLPAKLKPPVVPSSPSARARALVVSSALPSRLPPTVVTSVLPDEIKPIEEPSDESNDEPSALPAAVPTVVSTVVPNVVPGVVHTATREKLPPVHAAKTMKRR